MPVTYQGKRANSVIRFRGNGTPKLSRQDLKTYDLVIAELKAKQANAAATEAKVRAELELVLYWIQRWQ